MVQTRIAGTDPSEFCNRCFKDSPKLHYVDGQELYLCGGCGYDLRAWTNFLRANGLGIRTVLAVKLDENKTVGEGIEGVEGGEKPPVNATGRGRSTK